MENRLDKEKSLCAIGDFPYKALNNKKLLKMIIDKKFRPLQAMIIPTNRCNLKCTFCCCDDRIVSEELTIKQIDSLFNELKRVGTTAITLTGGGEPTLHPDFFSIVINAKQKGFKIGLVTNGTTIDGFDAFSVDTFEWVRVSMGDGRSIDNALNILKKASDLYRKKVFGYLGVSYVLTRTPDTELINAISKRVDDLDIAYLKFIIDENLCNEISYDLILPNISSNKAIFTPMRFDPISMEPCMLHWLKPIFAPDGMVYPCCEIQYNTSDKSKQYQKEKGICSFSQYFTNLNNPKSLPIMSCKKCFHATFVKYLNSTFQSYIHEDWI